MAEAYLGAEFDIHGGGLDLIFPHHENEIAQSRCAYGTRTMAKYWMHNGFVTVEGEKMSKSLGNFYTVHDLLEEWPGEVIRFLLLSAHYRAPLDFSQAGLRESKAQLDRLYEALDLTKDVPTVYEKSSLPNLEDAMVSVDTPSSDYVAEALCDDLNTPLAISRLHYLVSRLNTAQAEDKPRIKASLLQGAELLGLLRSTPDQWFRGETEGISPIEIERLLGDRAKAREAKNFAEADRIRDVLKHEGIEIKDSPEGPTWKRA